jgi:type IV pilus assembly protein PilC
MPNFAYTARDASGNAVSGVVTADNAAEVPRLLRAEGKYPTGVRLADSGTAPGSAPRRGFRISRHDLIAISTQLSIMIETGVPISEALECVASQSDKPHITRLVNDISQQIQNGSSFSSALARHPRSFPRIYVALMAASEKSGMMSRLMNRATTYLRDEEVTIRRVRGALTYPAIMLAFAITTTIFLLTFVLPRFTAIYASRGAALPIPTRFLIAVSGFVVHEWPWLVTGVILVAVAMWSSLRSEGGRRAWHAIQLRLPLLGAMFRKLYLSQGLRMVGTMANSGVNLIDCVRTAHDLCPNVFYRELWDEIGREIQSGKQLSEPMLASRLVPRSVSQMLRVGERTGRLGTVMEQVAGYSEEELKEKIADLTRCIEPIMIVVMGGIIGTVALALMLPIFTISRVVAR